MCIKSEEVAANMKTPNTTAVNRMIMNRKVLVMLFLVSVWSAQLDQAKIVMVWIIISLREKVTMKLKILSRKILNRQVVVVME